MHVEQLLKVNTVNYRIPQPSEQIVIIPNEKCSTRFRIGTTANTIGISRNNIIIYYTAWLRPNSNVLTAVIWSIYDNIWSRTSACGIISYSDMGFIIVITLWRVLYKDYRYSVHGARVYTRKYICSTTNQKAENLCLFV